MKAQPLALAGRYAAAAIAALSLMAASSAQAADRHVVIINKTNETMVSFFASNNDRDSWEEDILGRSTLDPGESVNIDVDDGSGKCLFDFKAVFDDGTSVVKQNVNVCKITSFSFTE